MTTLKAEKRSMDVKAKRLRREGYVTGNVIGKEIAGSVPVKILKTEAERLLKTCTKGSRINLEVDGTPMDVLIKDISLNPMKGGIMEMDFQALVNGEKVHSVAEVYLLNHEKVTTGILQQHLQEIAYKAVPAALVEKVEIDVGGMRLGDSILVKDLPIASNPDIDLTTDPQTVVVSVSAHRGGRRSGRGGCSPAVKRPGDGMFSDFIIVS